MMKVIDTAALILSEKAVRASQFLIMWMCLFNSRYNHRTGEKEAGREQQLYYPPREEQSVGGRL